MRNNYTLLGRQAPSRSLIISLIITITILSSLAVLYALPTTPAVFAPYVNKVQEYWKTHGGVLEEDEGDYGMGGSEGWSEEIGLGEIEGMDDLESGTEKGSDEPFLPGREAAKGGLSDVGLKQSFKTNLRDDKYYLISWGGSAGWTNVFFTQLKNIHLAQLSSRIPIILPTYPSGQHLTHPAQPILMSDIFDLERLSKHLNLPLIEMEDLKGPNIARKAFGSDGGDDGLGEIFQEMERRDENWEWEELGCWSLSQTSQNNTRDDFGCENGMLRLKFTPLPTSVLMPEHPQPYGFTAMTHLAEIFTPNSPSAPVVDQGEIKQQQAWHPGWEPPSLLPEDRLGCIDSYLFFSLPHDDWEGGQWMDRTNATWNTWNEIGRYTYWKPDVQQLADSYLRKAFKLDAGEEIPDYMSVHIRRTDLLWACYNEEGELQHDCLSPKLFRHKVNELKEKLREEKGVSVGDHVVVTTDEEDVGYLDELRDEGMIIVDHAEFGTIEKYGAWWPTILDAVFLSGAKGFVGTQGSTMSEVAVRRVEDWHHGIGVQVSQWDRLPEEASI